MLLSKQFLLTCLFTIMLGSCSFGSVTETYNKQVWQATVGKWTTIPFTGWASLTLITNEYQKDGVIFAAEGNHIAGSPASCPNDGAGLRSTIWPTFGRINATFTRHMYWVAVDHPTPIRIMLYREGALIYTSNPFYDDISRFAGIVSTEPFDAITIERTADNSLLIDDLFFGPIPVPCPADITGDSQVNVSDLLAVINAWGPCALPCPPRCAADINDDCTVNVSDLLAVINGWGPCP